MVRDCQLNPQEKEDFAVGQNKKAMEKEVCDVHEIYAFVYTAITEDNVGMVAANEDTIVPEMVRQTNMLHLLLMVKRLRIPVT